MMETNVEKYSNKNLSVRDAQIANAIETHQDHWQKEIHPGNYILVTRGYAPRCYRVVSIDPIQDVQIKLENGIRTETQLDTFHLNVKAVGFDPFDEKEFGVGSLSKENVEARTLDANDYGREYYVFETKEELLEYVQNGASAINENNSEFLKQYNVTDDEEDNSTALVSMSSKNTYVNAEHETLALKEEMERRLAIVKLCIEEQKNKFDIIRRNCEQAIQVVRRKLTRIQRILGQIELYTGVNENIVQIQEGAPASMDEPINFYQEVLFMDEEVGDWKDGGLDFTKIEQFDEWLLRDNHLDLFLDKRGVRVFRVRRYGKRGTEVRVGNHFTHNPYFVNSLDPEDRQTYVVIRNGDNVYRIWADHIIYPYLFPKQNELQKMIDDIDKSFYRENKKEQIEDFIDKYKFNFCLLQGLLDRSDVLAPHNPINLFKEGLENPYVNFVYDAEFVRVSDGHPSYWNFVNEVNKDIKVGSRVLFLNKYVKGVEDRFDARFYSWQRDKFDDWGLPLKPNTGIYTVEKNTRGDFVIKYMPEKEYYFEPDRKNKIAFKIYTDANEVLNYDALDLETVEYYLNNRINRADYLDIMPMLENVRTQILKEMEMENSFIMLIKGQAPNASEDLIKETIKWWKLKNKVKRPITSNDELAYKQILNKINKFLQ